MHVGASLYHDMVPAGALGYRTVFINRHGEPLGRVRPTRVLADLAHLPETSPRSRRSRAPREPSRAARGAVA